MQGTMTHQRKKIAFGDKFLLTNIQRCDILTHNETGNPVGENIRRERGESISQTYTTVTFFLPYFFAKTPIPRV